MNPDLLELAHTTINAAEAAYRRGDLMERRRMLMADWANYVTAPLKFHKRKASIACY